MGGFAGKLTVLTLALTMCGAGAAFATIDEVDGVTYVSVTGAANVSADCPAGSSLTGSGFFTGSPSVKSFMPADGPDSDSKRDDRVTARAGAGELTVQAVCVAGRVRVMRGSRSVGAHRGGAAKADCPAGTRAVGGGERLAGPSADARLNSSAPFDDDDANSLPDDGWRARMFNGGGQVRTLSAFALCRAEHIDYLGPSDFNLTTSDPVGLGTGECPQTEHAVSTWGRFNQAAGNASLQGLDLVDDGTAADSDLVPDDYGNVFMQRDDPATNPTLTSSVICSA
jgi:hypothetical protein